MGPGDSPGSAAIHDLEERRIRDLPVFEHRVELIVPRVRVACPQCGPRLERLSWLAPYARVTQRLVERGHADEVILKVLGGNYMRVFERVWGG